MSENERWGLAAQERKRWASFCLSTEQPVAVISAKEIQSFCKRNAPLFTAYLKELDYFGGRERAMRACFIDQVLNTLVVAVEKASKEQVSNLLFELEGYIKDAVQAGGYYESRRYFHQMAQAKSELEGICMQAVQPDYIVTMSK